MAQEEDVAPMRRNRLEPLPLDMLGVEELQLYVAELKAELLRVDAEIANKRNHRSAANAFFKRP